MAWFSFKGKRCDSQDVFCILEKLPLDIRSEKITQIIEMPTSEPIVYEPGGYKQQVITLTVGIKDISMEHIHNINNWLTGSGKLIFSNQPDRHYIAVCYNALSGTRMVEQMGRMPVQFTLMPFARENDDTFHMVELWTNAYGGKSGNTAGDDHHPNGTGPSRPTMKIYFNGLTSLHMTHHATYTDIDVDLTGLSDYIIFDCQNCKVYDKDNNVILNRVVGNIDAIITPGNNNGTFDFSAGITRVDCIFNRRWL